jgi:hypothetical protein
MMNGCCVADGLNYAEGDEIIPLLEASAEVGRLLGRSMQKLREKRP